MFPGRVENGQGAAAGVRRNEQAAVSVGLNMGGPFFESRESCQPRDSRFPRRLQREYRHVIPEWGRPERPKSEQ